MSTRCTIGHNDAFHLYEECFDTGNVYLQLDSGFEASLCLGCADWRDNASGGRTRLELKLDVKTWRAIAEAWQNSHWAQHPERDGSALVVEVPDWMAELVKKGATEGGQEPG